ncbi:MAG TPA: PTS sugar transporter subunit IIC, partial [Clostridiaceae bacterium]|nr:PTS sugar transporter subunit IIC [Clostridiaceae bacterium]
KIFHWVYKKDWTIKLPKGVPPSVFNSFAALIPSAIVMLIFFIIRILFEFTPYENAFDFVYKVLQAPLMAVGDSLGAEIIYVLLSSVFWFFGINGPSVTNTVYSPMHMSLSVENVKAFQQGLSLPHIYTQQFVDMFETFGG